MALQTHIFAEIGNYSRRSKALQPTAQMLFEVVEKKVREHNKAIEFLAHGYQHATLMPTPTPSPCGNGKNPYYRVPTSGRPPGGLGKTELASVPARSSRSA